MLYPYDHVVSNKFVGLASPGAPRFKYGPHPCQGLYWTAPNIQPKVAIITTHYDHDMSEHYLAQYFAKNGYGFLGWNTRFRGKGDQFLLEQALIDIGTGIRWLKDVAGAETIVLLGNSGGGSLMAAYQAEAQNPILSKSIQGELAEALGALPEAQYYISLNAHPGRPDLLTNSMDASVIDEADPIGTDESLKPFNPKNGPPFSTEFIARYRAAQRARNQRVTDWVKAERTKLNAAGIPDKTFSLYRLVADLRNLDPNIDPSDRPTPACIRGEPAVANRAPGALGSVSTLATWLSMWSLETSKCRAELYLPHITAPSLVIQSTHDVAVFPSDAHHIFGSLGTSDKSLHLPPGAHFLEDAPEHRQDVFALMDRWLKERL